MEQPIISLIIPFFNSEKYLSKCLDNVYNQNISESQYEVICVNDDSPDKSRLIILEYQKNHNNLILIEHNVNRKLGAARNSGRNLAKGKYLWNIDADDHIQPNILKNLIEICESNQLDILMFNFNHLVNNVESLNIKYPFPNSEVLNGITYLNKYCLDNFSEISPVWTQIYNIDFLNKNKIYSPEINTGEDGPYTYKSLLLAKRIMSIKNSCYVYRANDNSIGGLMQKSPNAIELFTKCFIFTMHIALLIKFVPIDEKNIMNQFKLICRYSASTFPKYYALMNIIEKKSFREICRNNLKIVTSTLKWMGKKNILLLLYIFIFPFSIQKRINPLLNKNQQNM